MRDEWSKRHPDVGPTMVQLIFDLLPYREDSDTRYTHIIVSRLASALFKYQLHVIHVFSPLCHFGACVLQVLLSFPCVQHERFMSHVVSRVIHVVWCWFPNMWAMSTKIAAILIWCNIHYHSYSIRRHKETTPRQSYNCVRSANYLFSYRFCIIRV